MKALIRKDFLSLWTYCRNYFIICGAFLAASIFVSEYDFLKMYPLVLMGMLPTTLIAYDERDKWDVLCLAMPLTRRQIVTARYLTGALLQGGVFLMTALAAALQAVVQEGGIVMEIYLMDLAVLLVPGLVAPAMMMPFAYKLGSEKGRMGSLLALGVILGVGVGGSMVVQKLGIVLDVTLMGVALTVIALCLMLYPLSWALSVHWYEKREF